MRDLQVTPMQIDEVRDAVRLEHEQHRDVIDAFHRVFYDSPHTHTFTNWMGVPILKNPLDLHIYQEILWDLQPTLIIETGTAYGGSSLFFATMLDRRGEGRVLSIDVEPFDRLPQHPRVSYLRGSSTWPEVLAAVRGTVRPQDRVMVVLDSDHAEGHVMEELHHYAPLVTPGQFLVVEDTNINGHPVARGWYGGPGPMPAVSKWLPAHPEFERDYLAERMMVTFYPSGWLRRVA